ncbi:hypothetical protein C1M53_09735 [Mesorhizobium sp. Pch-S]|nr:hypothetical protein C1M53_09735 [Mesorhizobium sp. Pch-S]
MWLNRDPERHATVDEVYRDNIARLVERGTWTLPAHEVPGARYTPAPSDGNDDWAAAQAMWAPWNED